MWIAQVVRTKSKILIFLLCNVEKAIQMINLTYVTFVVS
jgi:hypothetical protein